MLFYLKIFSLVLIPLGHCTPFSEEYDSNTDKIDPLQFVVCH